MLFHAENKSNNHYHYKVKAYNQYARGAEIKKKNLEATITF
jgi:hypothetical protein